MKKIDYNSIGFKNKDIDRFQTKFGNGNGDDKKISFHEDRDKTYQETSYSKKPLHSKSDGYYNHNTDSSCAVPPCSSQNGGMYRNNTVKMKTLKNDRRVTNPNAPSSLRYQ